VDDIQNLDLASTDNEIDQSLIDQSLDGSISLSGSTTNLVLSSPSGSFLSTQVPIDLIIADEEIEVEDILNTSMRATMYFKHQYPAARNGSSVLSFEFGILPIIHESIGHRDPAFMLLKSVIKDRSLLVCCLAHVKGILISRHNKEDYLGNKSLAFNLLREKHVLSVITKVLLLPLVIAWFPSILDADYVFMSSLPNARGQVQDVKVKVRACETGLDNPFLDIEKEMVNESASIDYFAR
jgi:hypothetical protein